MYKHRWITSGTLLNSTGNSAQGYVPAWMGGEFGEEWIHVCVWLSPFTVHLELPTTLLIDYATIQSVSGVKKKKKDKRLQFSLRAQLHLTSRNRMIADPRTVISSPTNRILSC